MPPFPYRRPSNTRAESQYGLTSSYCERITSGMGDGKSIQRCYIH